MSHGITSTDSMFSVREVPWHGLGAVFEEPPADARAAIAAAGLDWDVIQTPLHREEVGDADTKVYVPGWLANVRSDTRETLGIVASTWTSVNNRDAFAFLDNLSDEYAWESGGSISGGKRVWGLVKRREEFEVGGDPMAPYLFVATGHDGSLGLTAAPTLIRIVCNNTLSWALDVAGRSTRTWKFRHTGSIHARLHEAQEVMRLQVDYDKRFKELGDRLAREGLTERRFRTRVLEKLFPENEASGDRAAQNRQEAIEACLTFFRGEGEAGDTRGYSPGTKWTAVNAVAEYSDWGRRVTNRTNQVSRSFDDHWIKNRGLALVEAL